VPWFIRDAADTFSPSGRPNNGGTKIFSVSGDVAQPGIFEVPLGTPFPCCSISRPAWRWQKIKAVIPALVDAGAAGALMMATDMDYDSIAKPVDAGSGAVIVMDETRCMVRCLERLAYFYFEESCGQCTPCREGTGWLYRVVHRIETGNGKPQDLELLNSVADNIQGRTICALGDAAAMPVRAFIKHFRSEFEHHIEHKHCLVPEYASGRCRQLDPAARAQSRMGVRTRRAATRMNLVGSKDGRD